MKPMLAHVYEPQRVTYPTFVQPKLNGIRALYQNGHFQSRDEIPFPDGLLTHLSKPLLELFNPSIILDGELYVHGWPLQRINGAVTPVRQEANEDTLKVEYHIFDQVNFQLPFKHRFTETSREGPIKWVKTRLASDEEYANQFYAKVVYDGYEGMMYRLGDCPYTRPKMENINEKGRIVPYRGRFLSDKNNRTWHLLKRKSWQDDEFLCVDVVEGEGKYKDLLGAVTCYPIDREGLATGRKFTVGSGLTDAEREFYWQNPPVGKKIKVKYLCLSSDGIPLNPTIEAIL